jgi:Putative auto-transporter adhesin, head GIN domain
MNLRRHLLLLALAVPLAAIAQPSAIVPSGRAASESRPLGAFTSVAFSLPGTLILKQGPAAPVRLEADDNLMPEIETVVEAGTLKIRFRRGIDVRGKTAIQVLVATPDLESLAVAGSGDAISEGLKTRALKIALSGSGSVRIAKLEADNLTASVAGSGSLRAAGRVGELTARIAGSGGVDAGRLEAARVRVSVAGSGDATFWAREALDASVAGSGDVRYYGDPTVKKSIAGSGTLKRLAAAP